MNVRKLLPIGGIMCILLIVCSVVVGGGTPAPDASASEVMSFYDSHHAREMAAAFVLAAAVPFLVFFAAALVTALWPDEDGVAPVWQLVLVAGSVLAGAALLLGATVHFALADGARHLSPAGLQVLNVIDGDFWMALNAGVAVMLFGAAGSALTRTVGYRRFGWAALVLGVVLFIPFADFLALLATALWIVAMSVVLLRGGSVARYAPAPGLA
jgi:MFS family permease